MPLPPRALNWRGRISTISSNNDGWGVLAVRLSGDVYLKTWNNALSDFQDGTLIDPHSALFHVASGLREEEEVVFSGTFFADRADCVRETSLSLSGSMLEPEYLFRFQSIRAAE